MSWEFWQLTFESSAQIGVKCHSTAKHFIQTTSSRLRQTQGQQSALAHIYLHKMLNNNLEQSFAYGVHTKYIHILKERVCECIWLSELKCVRVSGMKYEEMKTSPVWTLCWCWHNNNVLSSSIRNFDNVFWRQYRVSVVCWHQALFKCELKHFAQVVQIGKNGFLHTNVTASDDTSSCRHNYTLHYIFDSWLFRLKIAYLTYVHTFCLAVP